MTPKQQKLAKLQRARNRKKLRHEFWHRHELDFLLHKGQLKIDKTFLDAAGQLFVGNISRQWGKSYWAVVKAILQCLIKKRARVKYGTAFHTDLTEFILPAFEKILRSCPPSMKPTYLAAKSKWVFPNGSEIKLVGLDLKPNGLRGNTIDLIIVDEAGFVDKLEYLYKSVIIPATLRRKTCRVILISTPPSTPAHPFSDFFIPKAELEESYAKLTIYDNPQITNDDIERMASEMGGKESTTFRRECLCELILDDDLALVREWKEDTHKSIVVRDEFYGYYHKLVGQDLGRQDHTALVFGHYDFKRAALVIEDELTMEGPTWTTETLKAAIETKERQLWGSALPIGEKPKVFRRVSDNNNPHLLQDLASIHNLHFMAVKKDSSLEQMVNRVREWVKAGRIIIHPQCKMLLGCMKYGIWDVKRKEFARSKVFGHFDHFAALMYLLIHTPISSNPVPADHGFSNDAAWLAHVKRQPTSNAAVLEKAFGFGKKR